jgi:hypothetical protein
VAWSGWCVGVVAPPLASIANPSYGTVYLSGSYTSIDVDFELCEALRARMAGALTIYISESFFVRGPCKQPALNRRMDHCHRESCCGAKKTPVSSVSVTIGENRRKVRQIFNPYRVKLS